MNAPPPSQAWRNTLLGGGLMLVGVALASMQDTLRVVLGAVLIALGLAMIFSAWSRRHPTAALFRLDHFLPSLKRAKKAGPLYTPTWIVRAAQRLLPASWFVEAGTLKPGKLRRLLQKVGAATSAAPLRRVIQALCFTIFLVLFFYVCWPYSAQPVDTSGADAPTSIEQLDALLLGEAPPAAWPSHYTDDLARKEVLPADLFLRIDPLVSLSTAIASRSWVWSLMSAGVILIVCVVIPRGFCGYLCPLGTLIDLFDWALGRRIKRFRVAGDGWWVHIKYYVLLGTLIAAGFGVLISGFFSAIPVITRGMLFLGEPLQTGFMRGWHLVVPLHWGHVISVLMFLGVLALGLLRPRFWCKYVCPSGAVFSVANLFRVSERKVEDSCINCNKCVAVCPFDAIKPDFTTRVTDCTLCQTCGGVCPTQSIKFVERWNFASLKVENDPPTGETSLGRRGFVSLAAGGTAAVLGGGVAASATKLWGARLDDPNSFRPVRPPGSVPEQDFLQMCIRCGECFKACPNNVLHAEGFEQGFEGLWTPMVKADWAGCESSCNACGQVCPTGAIQPLTLEVKKTTRMGLAELNLDTCLPHGNREACQLCVDDCTAAGYNAIEFVQVHTETDSEGNPVDGTGYLAPVVLADKCVGCGLCQTRCHGINVLEKGLLKQSAIIIFAGEGKEDRRMPGSDSAGRLE